MALDNYPNIRMTDLDLSFFERDENFINGYITTEMYREAVEQASVSDGLFSNESMDSETSNIISTYEKLNSLISPVSNSTAQKFAKNAIFILSHLSPLERGEFLVKLFYGDSIPKIKPMAKGKDALKLLMKGLNNKIASRLDETLGKDINPQSSFAREHADMFVKRVVSPSTTKETLNALSTEFDSFSGVIFTRDLGLAIGDNDFLKQENVNNPIDVTKLFDSELLLKYLDSSMSSSSSMMGPQATAAESAAREKKQAKKAKATKKSNIRAAQAKALNAADTFGEYQGGGDYDEYDFM